MGSFGEIHNIYMRITLKCSDNFLLDISSCDVLLCYPCFYLIL